MLDAARVDTANEAAFAKIVSAEPVLTDVRPAAEVIPGLGERDFLHAGPPLDGWDEACGVLQASVLGTLVHTGRAADLEEAQHMAAEGAVRLLPANDWNALGTYGGVIAAETPVFVVENSGGETRAYAALNEGRGKALRYGANDPETLSRIAWLEGEFAALLGAAVRLSGGFRLFDLLAQALHMGDEGHSRQKAASALFLNAICPYILETDFSTKEIGRAVRFMAGNEIFFLPLSMAAAKTAMTAGAGVPDSSLVTCMAINGVRFGLKVSGRGDEWFTAPAPHIHGQYFAGYGPEDANPVIGDSEIAETMGLGAFAMAGAPALARYVGGTVEEATQLTLEMYTITMGEHPRLKIPALDYRGIPTGVDVRRVVEQRVKPVFSTGIAHRRPGIGQIGAGSGRVPLECCVKAYQSLSDSR